MSPEEDSKAVELPQALASSDCLPCQVCCRFPARDSPYRPYFTARELQITEQQGWSSSATFGRVAPASADDPVGAQVLATPDANAIGYLCPFLEESTHACRIYDRRPLDCRLYPLMVALTADGRRAVLHLDAHCPVNARYDSRPDVIAAALAQIEARAEELATEPNLIADRVDGLRIVAELPELTRALGLDANVRRLRHADRDAIESAGRAGLDLETPAGIVPFQRGFVPLYLNRERHAMLVCETATHLIVIARHGGLPFFPIAPLGGAVDANVLRESEALHDRLGGGATLHLPAVRVGEVAVLEAHGYQVREEGKRVVASRQDLVDLRGRRFHSHRRLIHRFTATHSPVIRPAQADDIPQILALFGRWYEGRAAGRGGELGRAMAIETQAQLRRALHEREQLGLVALVLELEQGVAGFTAGAPLGAESFVVLFEFVEVGLDGAAELLAHEMARAAAGHSHLDLMDTCGLPSVAFAKSRYGREVPVLGALKRRIGTAR